MMCKLLEVSRSGYYAWCERPPSNRKKKRDELIKQIRKTHQESRELYGSPKITKALNNQGVQVSERTVSRLMTQNQIRSKTVRKYKATTNSKHQLPVHDNVLDRQFTATKPNEKWVTDITYVQTGEGWLYLASVMDLFSRRIVGWKASDRMTKELVLEALNHAVQATRPTPGLIHHSDRGSQYASLDYQKELNEHEMIGSMSRKGNCYDNACIESFHGILKRELIYLNRFKTRQEALHALFEYIEVFYNRKRIHSTIGYLSPSQFEQQFYQQQKTAA
jgi:putative transposase